MAENERNKVTGKGYYNYLGDRMTQPTNISFSIELNNFSNWINGNGTGQGNEESECPYFSVHDGSYDPLKKTLGFVKKYNDANAEVHYKFKQDQNNPNLFYGDYSVTRFSIGWMVEMDILKNKNKAKLILNKDLSLLCE